MIGLDSSKMSLHFVVAVRQRKAEKIFQWKETEEAPQFNAARSWTGSRIRERFLGRTCGDKCWKLNMGCRLDSVAYNVRVLNLITVLWLHKRRSLCLGNIHWILNGWEVLELRETEIGVVVTGREGVGNGEILSKGAVIRSYVCGDLMYSMVIIATSVT